MQLPLVCCQPLNMVCSSRIWNKRRTLQGSQSKTMCWCSSPDSMLSVQVYPSILPRHRCLSLTPVVNLCLFLLQALLLHPFFPSVPFSPPFLSFTFFFSPVHYITFKTLIKSAIRKFRWTFEHCTFEQFPPPTKFRFKHSYYPNVIVRRWRKQNRQIWV